MASLATQNHTVSATSSGVISRPIGCLAASAERACSVVLLARSATSRGADAVTAAGKPDRSVYVLNGCRDGALLDDVPPPDVFGPARLGPAELRNRGDQGRGGYAEDHNLLYTLPRYGIQRILTSTT
jgi:hypothetical protein